MLVWEARHDTEDMMPDRLTDAEALCSVMETRPPRNVFRPELTPGWWIWIEGWKPVDLTLDRLRLIEERLTYDQVCDYDALLRRYVLGKSSVVDCFEWHASAEQKKHALAEVLRAEVERG